MKTITTTKQLVIDEIVSTLEEFADFRIRGRGWISSGTEKLLRDACVENQVSLARTLRRFKRRPEPAELQGTLILAWAALGSLLEGTMKFFLCVHQRDYWTLWKLTRWSTRSGTARR